MKFLSTIIIVTCSLLFAAVSTAQTTAADNKVSQSITFHAIPKGPTIFGIFQGRPPRTDFADQLGVTVDADCEKLKCSLTLYVDSVTRRPAMYNLSIVGGGDVVKQQGGDYRHTEITGKWEIMKGVQAGSGAELYHLQIGNASAYLYLLKGDDNVLFVLNTKRELMAGNENFSYTLNRVELVPGEQ